MTATLNKPTLTIVVNGVDLPVPIRGNSAVATRIRAGVATEEWSMPSASTDEVYTVKRCLRTGRILHATCKCWTYNPNRDTDGCQHTRAVEEAAKLAELTQMYSGPEWTLGAIQAEDAVLRGLIEAVDSRLIRLQLTAVGTVIHGMLSATQEAA